MPEFLIFLDVPLFFQRSDDLRFFYSYFFLAFYLTVIYKNHENKINDNNTVIASSKASEKEISTALTSNEKTKAIIKNEKDICQLLTDKGYKECFCEIDGGHMKVVVKLKDATSKDANKIIKLIHNKYNGYIIEVKFVED